jgi:hypothetical protein
LQYSRSSRNCISHLWSLVETGASSAARIKCSSGRAAAVAPETVHFRLQRVDPLCL